MEGNRYMEKKLFVPGRTELAGNHTDHQQGRILASAVDLGLYADFEKNGENAIHIHSEGYSDFTVRLNHTAVRTGEFGTPKSLVRGMIAAFRELGLDCGGFNAEIRTTLPAGSGLSSSAAYTVLIGKILSELFNDGKVDPVVIARAAQQSENQYFGKPCGLMDQMASSVGGLVFIDFADPAHPAVRQAAFDFAHCGYTLCTLDSGADHADLTDEYAAIPEEMRRVARVFGKDVLREVDEAEFYAKLKAAREAAGDRAVLRAMHFFDENRRVQQQVQALERDDFEGFLAGVRDSGRSSWMLLQNVVPAGSREHQQMALALAACEKQLAGRGACRIHGGGFAGTLLAFVPNDALTSFRANMEAVLGEGRCHVLSIRQAGGVRLA